MARKQYNLEDEQFLQQLVFPEEDRHRFTTAPLDRGISLVPLRQYCAAGALPTGQGRGGGSAASGVIRR
jgi:hypothetical protein